MTRDDSDIRARIWVLPPQHPDWVSDWTEFDTISAWIYLEGETADGISHVRIGIVSRGSQDDGDFAPPTSVTFLRRELAVGWNHLEVDLERLLVFEMEDQQYDRRGELSDLKSAMFIDVTSSDDAVYFMDEIQFIRKH